MTSLMNQMDRDRMKPSNYQSAIIRIANATTPEELDKIENGLARVYNVGHLTTSELSRLSDLAMRRGVELEEERIANFSEWVIPPIENLNPLEMVSFYTIQAFYESPEEFEDWDEGQHPYSRDAAFDYLILTFNDGDGGVFEITMSSVASEMTETKIRMLDGCNYIDPEFDFMMQGMRKLKKVYKELMTKRDRALNELSDAALAG